MKKVLIALAWGALFVGGAGADEVFSVSSAAVKGPPETGFDSKLVSAGRADPAYNGGVSLPFVWNGVPPGTKALALIYEDPDARLVMKQYGVQGTVWIHWLAADIDPALGGLEAGAAQKGNLILGRNSGGAASYQGPQPPAAIPAGVPKPIVHVYRLTLYALSAPTGLKKGFSVDSLKAAMADKTLATAELLLSWSN